MVQNAMREVNIHFQDPDGRHKMRQNNVQDQPPDERTCHPFPTLPRRYAMSVVIGATILTIINESTDSFRYRHLVTT